MIWIAKNWKVVLALTLCGALAFTGWKLYRAGAENATLEARLKIAEAQSEFWADQLKTTFDALSQHAQRTLEDTAKITELNNRITSLNDYVETLEDRDSVCLGDTDVERLRHLWETDGSTTGAASSAPSRP